MAVRIPIITVFDSKGLKQAQYQLNKVRGNFQNLGRNFAVAGAAIAGVGVVIGKAVQEAAKAQQVLSQTESVLKSTGTTANGTAKDIQNLSARLMSLTAVEDETIQSGANLLLTFKNIQNQAGAGNDIFNQTVAAMLDVSRAMGTDVNGEAIRLGKALNDPIRGIAALTRVGIQFTEQQRSQIKALVESGDLMSAQKIILAELQSQFGGSAQAYAQTFAGQLEILNGEMGNLAEEIGLIVMPALRELVTAFRELAPEAGAKLKEALGSVNWSAFAKTLADTLTFLIQNAEAIIKLVATLWALNTAYNAVKITNGLISAANVILARTFTVTAGQVTLATGAVKLFRTALITTGIGALVVGLGFVIEAIINTGDAAEDGEPKVNRFTQAINTSGNEAQTAANKYRMAQTEAGNYIRVLAHIPKAGRTSVLDDYGYNIKTGQPVPKAEDLGIIPPDLTGPGGAVSKTVNGMKSLRTGLQGEARKQAAFVRLTKGKGLSEGLAGQILGGPQPLKTAAKIVKGTKKAARDLQSLFNRTQAGQAERQAADQAAAEAARESERQAAEALAERERVYKSFADSVASTFSSIKDSILSAFSLPELGGSTDSIIRNMDKLLVRVKDFSSNITKLSSMGLDPKLLQQVINAGPVAGAKLAANLVAGGAGALGAINAGYAELGNVASEIGMTGTQALFGTQAQQNVYNININGGLDSGPSIGKAVVEAVRAYERTSGPVWQGA